MQIRVNFYPFGISTCIIGWPELLPPQHGLTRRLFLFSTLFQLIVVGLLREIAGLTDLFALPLQHLVVDAFIAAGASGLGL